MPYLNPGVGDSRENGTVTMALSNPVARGTAEVQLLSITGTPTGGYIRIGVTGYTRRSDMLTYAQLVTASAGDAETSVKTALNKLPGVNITTVARSGSTPNYIFTCTSADLEDMPLLTLNTNALTGGSSPTCTPSVSTAGVAAEGPYAIDTVVIDSTYAREFLNKGTVGVPALHQIGGRPTCVNKAATYTVTAAEMNGYNIFRSTTGAVTFNLPAAAVGMSALFFVGVAATLTIDPNAAETVALPSTMVQQATIAADAIGEWVRLVCLVAGTWDVIGYNGTWS